MRDKTGRPFHTHEEGMFVRQYGDGGGEGALVYLHGLGESGYCFESLLELPWPGDFTHVVPDLPGYGRSLWGAGPLPLKDLSDHVAAWLRRRRLSEVTLIGHSMGGVLAQLVTEGHPDLIRAVINVDGNVSRGDCTFSALAAAMSEGEFLGSGLDRLRSMVFEAARSDRAQRKYYVSLCLGDPRSIYRHSCELVDLSVKEDLADRMARLQVPVLYIAGHPGGAAARSIELLEAAGIDTVKVEPSGHWPFVDQPEEFIEVAAEFLDSRRRSRRS